MTLAAAVRLAAIFSALLTSSCSDSASRHDKAIPITAQLGQLQVTIPDNAVFYQTRVSSGKYVAFRLCPIFNGQRSPDCLDFERLPVGRNGVRVLLHAPKPWTRFSSIRERPETPAPTPEPLAPTSLRSDSRRIGPNAPPGEHYALSRLENIYPGSIMTTAQGWPLIACRRDVVGKTYCIAGFAVRDVFVEATWHTHSVDQIDQREAWLVASAVDSRVRSLMRPNPTR